MRTDGGDEALRAFVDNAERWTTDDIGFEENAPSNNAGPDHKDDWAIHDAVDLDQGSIEPRAWLLGVSVCRRYVTVLAAGGGTGKTTLALAWALSLATGRSLIGEFVHRRARVLLITAEDGKDEVRRRLRAAQMHYKLDAIDRGWLHLLVLTGSGSTLATLGPNGQIMETETPQRIEAAVRHLGIDTVILDPFIKLGGAPENDNLAVDFVMRLLVRLADSCNVAVLLLHHVRKGQAEAGNAEMARGAKSLIDAARIALTLTPMTVDEAKAMGISEDERRRLVRLDDGKANLAPLCSQARWHRLASVNLGNGNADYPNGDNVQAIETWEPPDTWASLSSDLLNRVLDDIDAGTPDGERYSDASAAKERAAWQVVQRHASEKTPAQCRQVIKAWRKSGLPFVKEYTSSARREKANGLFVDQSRRPS